MSSLLTRTATFLHPDLLKASASYAKEKAKQMMGAGNPLTGSEIRKPASTFCSACGRWHRPGNVCPSATKSNPFVAKGSKVSYADVQSGNPYRNGGQFGQQPGGKKGKQAKVDCKDALSLLAQAGEPASPAMCEDSAMPAPPQPAAGVELEQAPMPPHLASESMLAWKPEPKEEKTPQDHAEAFQSGSVHLQGQEAAYLRKLREWQARFGG